MIEDSESDPLQPLDALAPVGHHATAAEAQEHALVILAMNLPCWVVARDDGFDLLSEPGDLPAIRGEIAAYIRESAERPARVPAGEPGFRHPSGWPAYAIWAAVLILCFQWQVEHPSWVDRGSSSSIGLIERHEWWRPVTAMFLHSDAAHLTGNLLGGAFFGTLVSRSIGSLRAWPMILACGALGNTVTSLVNWPQPFESIGASTAVFGALGILSGLGFRSLLRHRPHLTAARVAAPVIGGVVVLGLMGGGSPDGRTDVLGHGFGFLAGLALGYLCGHLSPAPADASAAGTLTAEHGGRT